MNSKTTYKDSGVDIEAGERIARIIERQSSQTQKKNGLIGDFKLFASSFDISNYQNPLLVTGCDGVGTKLDLLLSYNLLENAGKDLVAMNVNDVLTTGADPLVFQDYIAVNKIEEEAISRLIAGMIEHLASCECVLAGGETAEMPGLVKEGFVELSGFCAGCVEREQRVNPENIQEGDFIIGYPSQGIHANGWSLVRRILKEKPKFFLDEEIIDLLCPTPLYWNEVQELKKNKIFPSAMAHITGGGLPKNLGRLFSQGLGADISVPKWDNPLIQRILDFVDSRDSWSTFNMGVGWVVILTEENAENLLSLNGGAFFLGKVISGNGVRINSINL